MISINQAVENNVVFIRSPKWANPEDYLELTIVGGKLTPWIRLHSPMNVELHGRDPVELLCTEFDLDAPQFEIWQVTKDLLSV